MLSHSPSIAPSPVPSSIPPTCDPSPEPEGLSQFESGSDSNDDAPGSGHELDSLGPEGAGGERDEDDINNFMDAGGSEPKEDIRDWHKLQDRIKSDLVMAHKQHDSLSCINKFLILRNFATLRIKGIEHIVASQEIMQQWHDSVGVHFAHQIWFLAQHYQLFKYLPASNRGGDGSRSLLNNEQVQTEARTHLLDLPVGDVTATQFHRVLNERILPSLGYVLRGSSLSLRTARRWLCKLGWRCTELKKGVYMDGHE